MIVAALNFGNTNLFTVCFFWFFAGSIAGTVANFIVRGRAGCLVTNFFLGWLSALLVGTLFNFFVKQDITVDFFATTLIASVAATSIAYLMHSARRAESNYQQRLRKKYE